MKYGVTGNATKESLWIPVADLVSWLQGRKLDFCLQEEVAAGLAERNLVDAALCARRSESDLASSADVILSFGGDGTMLNSAHAVGNRGTPILGVNIGRLGFLAEVEVGQVHEAIERMEQGDYRIEERMVLQAEIENGVELDAYWALNEFVIERSGTAKLIAIHVSIDGTALNTYWADGLIIATPTGSTAYSLATGGPIMVPGCGTLIITPIAPHMLTVRPIVLPDSSVIEVRVATPQSPYILAADGMSTVLEQEELLITIRRAAHTVRLVKLPGQHFFKTIRSKLMWGVRHHG